MSASGLAFFIDPTRLRLVRHNGEKGATLQLDGRNIAYLSDPVIRQEKTDEGFKTVVESEVYTPPK